MSNSKPDSEGMKTDPENGNGNEASPSDPHAAEGDEEGDDKSLGRVIKAMNVMRAWAFGAQAAKTSVRRDSFLERMGMGAAPDRNPSTANLPDAGAAATTEEVKVKPPLRVRLKTGILTFTVESSSVWHYRWVGIISLLTLYNYIFLVLRAVFTTVQKDYWIVWLTLDYLTDLALFGDMFIASRTGYLEQGLMVRDVSKLARHYFMSSSFKMDLLTMLPTDLLYFVPSLGIHATWLRFNKLLKVYRVFEFFDKTETRTNFPNMFRISVIIIYVLVITHIDACLYFALCEAIGLGEDNWVYPPRDPTLGVLPTDKIEVGAEYLDFYQQYVYSFYWATLALTTIAGLPPPIYVVEYAFVTINFLVGIVLFAAIVGNVSSMITNMNATKSEFRRRMDGVKRYLEFRKVSKDLELNVIQWFDYQWSNKQSVDEESILEILPDKLKAEIAMHVHYDTLRRVAIFQDCEPGLLVELVLCLKLQVFSPGDYICRKGDIGREMYIVKQGRLNVVADDGKTVFVTLKEGSVFGELAILNIPGNKTGNRRTANVRSIGYTDLFCLSKSDLWTVLSEYPEAKEKLMQRGKSILAKDNLIDTAALSAKAKEEEEVRRKWEKLSTTYEGLQTRLARMLAEYEAAEQLLEARLATLEKEVEKQTLFDSHEIADGEPAHENTNNLAVPKK